MFYVYHIGLDADLTKGYVGVSVNPMRRFKSHARSPWPVGRAIRKHGLGLESLCIIGEYPEVDDAYAHEVRLRPTAQIGWNINAGGLGPRRFPLEVRRKISFSMRGVRNHRFGTRVSTEVREAIRRGHMGARNHRFGKVNDAAHRAKISTTLLAKPAEWRSENAAKAGRSNAGKEKSDTQKANMAEAARRRPRLRCPHCGKEGQVQGMKRYHMDNCKEAR